MSANGRFVAFMSFASNLVAGDTNANSDIFVHDRLLGITKRVSVGPAGVEGNGISEWSEISADGNRVVFLSRASNFVAGDSLESSDVFVRDIRNATTICVSVDPSGLPGTGICGSGSISGDGLTVGFGSTSSSLVAGDTNHLTDIFSHSLVTGVTTRVSVSSSGVQGDQLSWYLTPGSLSYDGRYVAFKSAATNLVPFDLNGELDIFVRDQRLLTTTRVNVDAQGVEAFGGRSSTPTISADGRYVGFYSFANNLVPADGNSAADVFIRKL